MEPHLIYTATTKLKPKVTWGEWIYCGVGNDFKNALITKTANGYFNEPTLYLVTTRTETKEITKQDIAAHINNTLHLHDLCIWDLAFKKVMEFNKIGVMRLGEVQ